MFWDSHKNEMNAEIWERNFAALLAFIEKHGHGNIPSSYVHLDGDVEVPLGMWLREMCKVRRANKLGAERYAKFQQLIDAGHLNWDGASMKEESFVNMRSRDWMRYYHCLLQFRDAAGHCNVALAYEVPLEDGTSLPLGRWLRDQRLIYKAGRLPFDMLTPLQKLVNEGALQWDDSYGIEESE